MNAFEEISEKITAAENGKGELLDAFMSIWINTPNVKKEQTEILISKIKQISPNTPQANSWVAFTDAMRYSLWPGLGNTFEKIMEAIELFQQNNDKQGEGVACAMLSLYYKNLGRFDKAQEAVNKAISYIDENGPFLYFLGVAHFQGGEINHLLKDYDAALNFLNKGLTYFKEDSGTFKARLLNGMGCIYRDKNELELAFDYFQKSLKHIEGMNHHMLESKNYADIGNYYFRVDDFEKSLDYQQKSLSIRQALSQTNPLITNYIELAELYLKQNMLQEALDYAFQAEKIAKEHAIIIKQYQADLTISNIYEAMGETTLALEYYKKYHRVKDEVFSQESARKMKQLSMHHEMETMQKEKEIFRLRNVVLKEALDEIEASIRYASRIQSALLPQEKYIDKNLNRLKNNN
jgi:tetratricopeptide (TPR) repeat protein